METIQHTPREINIEFQIYDSNPNLKAKAKIIDGEIQAVKLMFKSPRGQYYHFLNDAGLTANELLQEGKLNNA